jgi:RimJ/RimL family protein N-acetyltransferase
LADQQRGNGGRRLALWVLEKNCAARRAYARLGFVPTGERQRLPDGRYELRLRISLPSRR